MLAAIPFSTFPEIQLGPVKLFTFGLFVALGILVGVQMAARYAETKGVDRRRVDRLALWLVILGAVGARVAWVITHLDELDSPLQAFAVWEGGLTFTGSFLIAGLIAALMLRSWMPRDRWTLADGAGLGLAWGIAVGRLGCIAVGEHLGNETSFFLGWKYLGGVTREGPLIVGRVYHNTSVYEALLMLLLGLVLLWILYRVKPAPGVAFGIFCVAYGASRFGTDFFRTYDERLAGLTAAQFLCLGLVLLGIVLLVRTRARVARLGPAPEPDLEPDPEPEAAAAAEPSSDGDSVQAP